jgi:hypothetical protein
MGLDALLDSLIKKTAGTAGTGGTAYGEKGLCGSGGKKVAGTGGTGSSAAPAFRGSGGIDALLGRLTGNLPPVEQAPSLVPPVPAEKKLPEPQKSLRHSAVPAVPPVPAQNNNVGLSGENAGLPDHVIAGLERLAGSAPLWEESPDRWKATVETVRRLAGLWDAQARRLGWRDTDLYGLHPRAPRARYDCKGLFWMVSPTDRIAALDDGAASIEKPSGNIVRYYRTFHDTEAVLAWNITFDHCAPGA